MQKISTLLLSAAVALTASAAGIERPAIKATQAPLFPTERNIAIGHKGVNRAAVKENKLAAANKKAIKKVAVATPKGTKFMAPNLVSEQVVLEETFACLTEGTSEDPVEIETDDYYNIPEDIIGAENYGWGGVDIYSAGGSVYLPYDYEESIAGYIWSPDIYGGCILTVTFDACSIEEEGEVDVYWVTDEGYEDFVEVMIDDTFRTYSVTIDATSVSTSEPIWIEFDSWKSNVMIKNVVVTAEFAEIDAPEALDYSDFTGTSFTANWTAVDGADHYLLTVAEIDPEVYAPVEPAMIEDQEVEGTSYVVDITPGVAYCYWVKAVDAEGNESFKSNIIEVATILPVTEFSGTIREDMSGFDATWTAPEGANAFVLSSKLYHKASADETYMLADADFSDIESVGTIDSPVESEYLVDEYEQLPGWSFILGVTAEGAVGVQEDDFYSWFGVRAQIESGEMDLSGVKDGKVTLTVEAASGLGNGIMAGLLVWDDIEQTYQVVDFASTDEPLTDEFEEYTFEFTGGTDRSIIIIMCDDSFIDDEVGNLLIRSLKLSADVEKGSVVEVPGPSVTILDETEASVDMACQEGDYFSVIVKDYTLDEDGYVYIEGPESETFIIDSQTLSIGSIANENANGAVRYYNLQGIEVKKPAAGNVVIRVQGNKANKVLVK